MNVQSSDLKAPGGARTITTQIRSAIESGVFTNGAQLPSERELSDTYSSSRSTIRKALDNLEQEGLVVRKVGSGTFVTYDGPAGLDIESVIDRISPVQLVEARIGFERQMTRLAVVHATGHDIEQMERVLDQLELSENNQEAFTKLDADFHLLLARASGNPLLYNLYRQINEVRMHSQWQAARQAVLSPERIRTYNTFHRGLLEALRRRNVSMAIDELNKHMDLAHQDVVGNY